MILMRKRINSSISGTDDHLNELPINSPKEALHWHPPTRSDLLKRAETEHFDLLVVGGGATGTGVALDAATRGLKVLLIERGDFSSGTSSKSTKLIHGGVRYLEKAFKTMDFAQFALVKDALLERSILLKICPHLTQSLPIMLPIRATGQEQESNWSFIKNAWKVPYYWAGAKVYDLFAGSKGLEPSYFLSRKESLKEFPLLKENGLFGSVVYHDGAQNDSRTNVALALTSTYHGSTCVNYCELSSFTRQQSSEQINGAIIRDILKDKDFKVTCDQVVNATGPFSDSIRRMANPTVESIISPSTGVHLVLPPQFSPRTMGILDPSTNDGRVLFLLPWEGKTVAGTTDEFIPQGDELEASPTPTDREIDWIIKETKGLLKNADDGDSLSKRDILSAWSGIRPLVKCSSDHGGSSGGGRKTESLVRDHLVERDAASNLVTIAGGKWTTYRKMASDTVDEVLTQCASEKYGKCITERVMLIGSHGFTSANDGAEELRRVFGMPKEVAEHLSSNYGDRASLVATIAYGDNGNGIGRNGGDGGKILVDGYPFLEGEARYSIRCEMAETAVDILSRRMRLAQLDVLAARRCLGRVLDIMEEERTKNGLPKWSKKERKWQLEDALKYLESCGSLVVTDAVTKNSTSKETNSIIGNMNRLLDLGNVFRKYSVKQWKRLQFKREDCTEGDLKSNLDSSELDNSFERIIIGKRKRKNSNNDNNDVHYDDYFFERDPITTDAKKQPATQEGQDRGEQRERVNF